MPMLAERVDAVVGVDTHRDVHHAEIAHPTGLPIATCAVSNNEAGFAELNAWITQHRPGARVLVAIEGTRSYGIGLARALDAAGLRVIECERPHRRDRRGRGKSDPIDAHLAVLTGLRLNPDRLPTPRRDGAREALRILLTARRDLTSQTTAQRNRLRALLLTGDDLDRDRARGTLSRTKLTDLLTQARTPAADDLQDRVRRAELTRLAQAVLDADRALQTNLAQLRAITTEMAPRLLAAPGVGPVSAAQTIVSFSHPGRCRDDAAFAALAGTNPIPASSGRTTRHRLNRGGDRALNCAVHTIAAARMRCCPQTRDYVTKRRSEGKTTAEIRRCLKRYITRQLYRSLTAELLMITP
jgi:transposase